MCAEFSQHLKKIIIALMLIVGAQNSFSQNLTGQILSEATSAARESFLAESSLTALTRYQVRLSGSTVLTPVLCVLTTSGRTSGSECSDH